MEYICDVDYGAINDNGRACIGPVKFQEKLIRCRDCKYWSTGIAYDTVGRCKHEDHHKQITNKNYFCADADGK